MPNNQESDRSIEAPQPPHPPESEQPEILHAYHLAYMRYAQTYKSYNELYLEAAAQQNKFMAATDNHLLNKLQLEQTEKMAELEEKHSDAQKKISDTEYEILLATRLYELKLLHEKIYRLTDDLNLDDSAKQLEVALLKLKVDEFSKEEEQRKKSEEKFANETRHAMYL